MATTVRSIVLWRKEIENQTGGLANTLELFAGADADLQIVMGYRYPGNQAKAAVELSPITGKKLVTAAETAGFKASGIPALLVEGDNRPGLIICAKPAFWPPRPKSMLSSSIPACNTQPIARIRNKAARRENSGLMD